MRVAALVIVLAGAAFVTTASADDQVTYTATQTIPVPPASNYSGSGGGDGWDVALTPQAVYNVFHHQGSYAVACHRQSDAQPCWANNEYFTVSDANEVGFSSSGHSHAILDQETGKLYGFGTQNRTSAGGVICFDTKLASPTVNPFDDGAADPFCGFTPLTGSNEATTGSSGLSEGVQVGSRLFAFDFVPGQTVGPGGQNKLVCFDLATGAACPNQPFTVDVGPGTNGNSNFPAPAVTLFGDHIVIPITMGGTARLACFDASTLGGCAGSWPLPLGNYSSYVPVTNGTGYGGAFPKLSQSGVLEGFCLPMPGVPCFTLTGDPTAPLANVPDGVTHTGSWNGASVVVGPRVYIPHGYYPNGGPDEIECYDFNVGAGCDGFPKSFNGVSLLYTVNADPQRPDCLWLNSDDRQIRNFDAFTGGACGEGPIRVLASASVVNSPECTPGSWKTLQVTSPARSSYTSGTVSFRDGSNHPIPGVADVPLDSNGIADISSLGTDTSHGLPQFLITLNSDSGRPPTVTVQLTWTGQYDQSCTAKPGTVVENPPAGAPSAPGVPPKADVKVTMSGPSFVRAGSKATFIATVLNTGPDTATGVVLHAPNVPGASFVSASTTVGNGCQGSTCEIGTLASGASAIVTLVYSANQTGTMVVNPTVESDFDPDHSNNTASRSTPVIAPGAPPPPPPPPSQPATFNAIGTGTVIVNGKVVAPDTLLTVVSGDDIDVTDGSITIVTADGSVGTFSSSQPTARRTTSSTARTAANLHAEFVVSQAAAGGVTTLTLAGASFAGCGTPRSLSATNKTPIRQLWGSAKGSFATKGRYAAATVRGTIWLVQDRCDGTLEQTVEGVVDVLDSTKNTTVSVSAGQSYVALAPTTGTFTPPASRKQTTALVRLHGLRWAHRTFRTKAAFTKYLRAHGSTWTQFAKNYPALAKGLASRKS